MDAFAAANSDYSSLTALQEYHEEIGYDPNGNILSYPAHRHHPPRRHQLYRKLQERKQSWSRTGPLASQWEMGRDLTRARKFFELTNYLGKVLEMIVRVLIDMGLMDKRNPQKSIRPVILIRRSSGSMIAGSGEGGMWIPTTVGVSDYSAFLNSPIFNHDIYGDTPTLGNRIWGLAKVIGGVLTASGSAAAGAGTSWTGIGAVAGGAGVVYGAD